MSHFKYEDDSGNTPWSTFDKAVGVLRNFFASVGVLAVLAAIGYWSAK